MMCTVSNIGDQWRDAFPKRYPWFPAYPAVPAPSVTREEFETLRKEVEALKELLKAAKKFDEETGQPDCETDEKVELIKRIAKMVGVDMSEVFGVGQSQ